MDDNSYVTGKGMFGGIKGTYGRYSVGPRVTNLSAQLNDHTETVENSKRRRFKRKKESGYSGAGFWFSRYPNMVGTLGSGAYTVGQPYTENKKNKSKKTAAASDGMGIGGTTFNGGGAIS